MKALPPPVMLSTRIPFAGTYESIWSHAIDWEVEQRAENWQQDRDAFDREFPNLAHIPDKLIDYDSAFRRHLGSRGLRRGLSQDSRGICLRVRCVAV
jgi:hypothetical protein